MRPSKLIIKSTAQKVMANSGFGHRFHDLQYFGVRFFFFRFREFVINLRASIQKLVEKYQFYIILSRFKQNLDNYVFNISTCTIF